MAKENEQALPFWLRGLSAERRAAGCSSCITPPEFVFDLIDVDLLVLSPTNAVLAHQIPSTLVVLMMAKHLTENASDMTILNHVELVC
jgi:hypothetical protein